jgi:hypothetical protein
MGREILLLVGLQIAEAREAAFHLIGSERLGRHGNPPNLY